MRDALLSDARGGHPKKSLVVFFNNEIRKNGNDGPGHSSGSGSTAVGPHHQIIHLQLLDKINRVIRKLEPKLAEEMDLFMLLVF